MGLDSPDLRPTIGLHYGSERARAVMFQGYTVVRFKELSSFKIKDLGLSLRFIDQSDYDLISYPPIRIVFDCYALSSDEYIDLDE